MARQGRSRRRHGWRATAWPIVLTAAAGLGWTPGAVHAEPADPSGIEWVAGPDRTVLDVSSNGRLVATASIFSGTVTVVDTATGTATPLSVPGVQQSLGAFLSSDGRTLVVATDAPLATGDADGLTDAYAVTVATGAAVLLTPGVDGWNVDRVAGIDANGTKVLVRGSVPGLGQTAPFVGTAASTTQVGSAIGPNHQAYGLSDDGTVALVGLGSELSVIDLTTGTRTIVPDSSGSNAAVLSGNGRVVAFVDNSGGLRRWPPLSTGPAGVSTSALDRPAVGYGFSISDDGAAIAYLRETATAWPNSPPVAVPQVFVMQASGIVVASQPGTSLANEGAADAVMAGDGGSVTFSSYASNIGARTVTGRNVFQRAIVEPGSSVYSPLAAPERILDTRIGLGWTGTGVPASRTTITLPVRGLHGVPPDATAVAVQVAAAEGIGVGFVSLIPSGTEPGATANLNLDTAGQVIANMAIVPIGADGAITIYPQARTHVIVDLLGSWSPTTVATHAGRFQPLGPSRLLDTRPDALIHYTGTKPASGGITEIQVTGVDGVPTSGVAAVVLNVAATDTTGPGFIQVAPAAGLVPGTASTLNVDHAGQTISASTIARVDTNGRIAVYTQTSTHLVIDVAGWITDNNATTSVHGMFVPNATVTRLVDTRNNSPLPPTTTVIDYVVDGAAIVGNLAITQTAGPGFVQLGPTGSFQQGLTANINASSAGQTISNAFIVPAVSDLRVYTQVPTHYIIDISGHMT